MHTSERRLEKTERLRRMGRRTYILRYGVILWGGLTGLLWAAAMPFVVENWSFWIGLVLALVGFPIGGYFWGAWMWRNMERQWAGNDEAGERGAPE